MADDANLVHLYAVLDRMQAKVDVLLTNDIGHTSEIRSLREDIKEAKADLDTRLSFVEKFVKNWYTASTFMKVMFGIVVSIGALLTALAVIKDKLW